MTRRVDRTLKTARKELEGLLEEREQVTQQMTAAIFSERLPILAQRAMAIDTKLREVQEFCNLELLGSLESESRKLTRLTTALIVLTVVLALLTALLVYKQFT
jgi:hypothetical protein